MQPWKQSTGRSILFLKTNLSSALSSKSQDIPIIYLLTIYNREFEDDIALLFVNFLPQYTARAGYKARITMGEAFKQYYDNKHNLKASGLIKGRYEALTQGYTSDDVAKFDIGMGIASTTNSIPGSFVSNKPLCPPS